jgi:hypothetical protein
VAGVSQLLAQIPPEHEPLKTALKHLVNNFSFEEIAALTDLA